MCNLEVRQASLPSSNATYVRRWKVLLLEVTARCQPAVPSSTLRYHSEIPTIPMDEVDDPIDADTQIITAPE